MMSDCTDRILTREVLRLYKRARKLRRKLQAAPTFDEKAKTVQSYIFINRLVYEKTKLLIERRTEQIEAVKAILKSVS